MAEPLLPAECDRTKFSCSSLWKMKHEISSFSNRRSNVVKENGRYLSLLTGITVRANLPNPVVIP